MKRRGFTLIEMTIALAIAAVLFAAVVYGVGAITGARAKEASTELAGAIRSLYDTAALSGNTCRLVFELPGEREDDGEVTYKAECAKGGVTAGADREEEQREATHVRERQKKEGKNAIADDDPRFRRLSSGSEPTVEELMAQEEKRVDDAAAFSGFQSEDVPTRTLPSNVHVAVWTGKQRKKVTSGTAYLYFFPQGYTERAYIYMSQGDNVWTITVSPLTGKTVITPEELEPPRS